CAKISTGDGYPDRASILCDLFEIEPAADLGSHLPLVLKGKGVESMAMKARIEAYDLHTHTTASDGLLTPSESVRLAVERGLAGMAVTDHDTPAVLSEAEEAGRKLGVHIVPGVEISTFYGCDVHMLGLWVDAADRDFA